MPSITTPYPDITNTNYINSSAVFSEPIKPFDGLDHNYTPEEYLQHIEACVTFSLGLQLTSTNEYKFWNARWLAFIHCTLTGTDLSWYIRLNDTYKHVWHAFVEAFKKQFSSQRMLTTPKLMPLILSKKTMKHFVILL